MKATGITRKVDELGRVVIPSIVRRTLQIKIGDSLKVYTDDDCVIYKKTSNQKIVSEDAQIIQLNRPNKKE